MADTDLVQGDRVLDRARKLVALDRALIEIGEPGVLERAPDELASLEARLFGPPAAECQGVPGAPEAPEAALPALRLLTGALETRPALDEAGRQALRARLRLIPGGRQAV